MNLNSFLYGFKVTPDIWVFFVYFSVTSPTATVLPFAIFVFHSAVGVMVIVVPEITTVKLEVDSTVMPAGTVAVAVQLLILLPELFVILKLY